jgi:hypothetical protein
MDDKEKLKAIKGILTRTAEVYGDPDAAVIDAKLIQFVARKLAVIGKVQGPVGPAEPSPDTRPSWSY